MIGKEYIKLSVFLEDNCLNRNPKVTIVKFT